MKFPEGTLDDILESLKTKCADIGMPVPKTVEVWIEEALDRAHSLGAEDAHTECEYYHDVNAGEF